MKKNSILLVFILQFLSIHAFSQWQEIFDDTNYYWLSDIKFLNKDTGFVCGASETWPYSVVFKTTDGGNSWDTSHLADGWLMSLSIVNDSIIYAAGQDGEIYQTINGGQDWVFFLLLPGLYEDISSIHFLNIDTAIAIRFNSGIWRTTNRITWTRQQLGGHSYFPNNSSIQFINDSVGFAVLDTVYMTEDYGLSWKRINVDSALAAKCLYMKNDNDGIVIGKEGKISLTFDRGTTWTSPLSISNNTLYDVKFVNDTTGFIISGIDYHSDSSEIFVTHDKGYSWQLMQKFNYDLTTLEFLNDSVGFVVGKGGKILKISNANTFGISTTPNQNAIDLFPNPFSNNTTLKLNFPLNDTYKFKIYNLLGECVKEQRIIDESTQIFRNSLSSGIYLIHIFSNQGFSSTIKLIVN